MKRLIAQRPILYMGRTYERGDALPAHDPKMVAAWLRARSAAWSGQERRQDPPAGEGGQGPAGSGNAALEGMENGGGEDAAGLHDGEVETEDTLDVVDGHLTVESLMKLTRTNMEKLAADMGVDISKCRNKTDIATLLAAVEVQTNDGGEAPPELGMEAPVV